MAIFRVMTDTGNHPFVEAWDSDEAIREYEYEHPEVSVIGVVPATVRESLEFSFGESWERSIDHVVTRLDDYPAKEPIIVFRLAQSESIQGYGDTVSVSNYRVLRDSWSDYEALDARGPYWDVDAITVRLDELAPSDLIDVINGLSDYPLLDESDHSEVEMELIDEHWQDYGRNDTLDTVAEALGLDNRTDLTEYAGEVVDTLTFNGLIELSKYGGEYPTIEDYSSVDFGAKNVAAWIKARRGRTVILPHYGREFRFDLRDSALIER